MGLIRTSRHSFTSHVDIGSYAQRGLADLFSNYLISASANLSIMDMQNSSTNGIPCDKVLEGNSSCIFNLLTEVIKSMGHIFI